MSKVVRQVVVMSTGEVRLPDATISIAHGHRTPSQKLTINFPAGELWTLVDIEVDLPASTSPDLGPKLNNH